MARLLLYELGTDLQQAQIHSIAVDDGKLWIGSGRGLIEFVENGASRVHRQFADAPFEWTRHVRLGNGVVAVDSMVANGSTGGHYAGSHLFDKETGEWHELGDNVLDHVWLDGTLWQRPARRMLTRVKQINGAWHAEDVSLSSQLCSEAQLAAVDGELWIAQQGTVRFSGGLRNRGSGSVKDVACGVLRFNPETGTEMHFRQQDGLNVGFGRDIVGDGRMVLCQPFHQVRQTQRF